MKNRMILKFGFIGNLVIILFVYGMIIAGFFIDNESFESFVFGDIFAMVRIFCGLLIFAYWIYLVTLWSKYDKKISRFFALFFLFGLYSIFYSKKILRNENFRNSEDEKIQ
jgi:hypothetical protein